MFFPTCRQCEQWIAPFVTLSQNAFKTHLSSVVSGVYKGIQSLPSLATEGLAYWQDKISTAYNDHLPFFRRTLLRKVWATAEEIRAFEQEASNKINKYRQDPQNSPSTVQKITLDLDPNYSVSGIQFADPSYDSYIIYFGGVSYLWQSYFDILKQLHTTLKSNVLAYNYRGCADLEEVDPTTDQILADGTILIEKLIEQGIPAEKITLWGRSLGGGISVCLAAHLAKRGIAVNIINERSFRSLSHVVKESVPSGLQNGVRHIDTITKSFKWQLNPEEAMHDLQGRLMVIYHELDKTIPLAASFFAATSQNPPQHLAIHTVKMVDGPPSLVQPKTKMNWFTHAHCRGFTQDELDAISNIFLHTWKVDLLRH